MKQSIFIIKDKEIKTSLIGSTIVDRQSKEESIINGISYVDMCKHTPINSVIKDTTTVSELNYKILSFQEEEYPLVYDKNNNSAPFRNVIMSFTSQSLLPEPVFDTIDVRTNQPIINNNSIIHIDWRHSNYIKEFYRGSIGHSFKFKFSLQSITIPTKIVTSQNKSEIDNIIVKVKGLDDALLCYMNPEKSFGEEIKILGLINLNSHNAWRDKKKGDNLITFTFNEINFPFTNRGFPLYTRSVSDILTFSIELIDSLGDPLKFQSETMKNRQMVLHFKIDKIHLQESNNKRKRKQ
jgi:hypothetical protein